MEQQDNKNGLNIELSADIAQGIYSNLAVISHSGSEFIIDFVRMMPGIPKAPVKSRIILSPDNAKRLLKALGDNIRKYEQAFGEIKEQKGPQIPMNFGGPTAKA
ncbi:MAG: DUF3467 domain-containing protein [Bacteroidales bacterium]|nr:DUF3467 domain-containing protein [Bacteroidales bacterium]